MPKKKLKSKAVSEPERKSSHQTIRVGVGGVIEQSGKWLLMKRSSTAGKEPGKWEFPGGALESGARLTESLVKMMKDKYGVEIEVGNLLGIFEGSIDSQHWLSPQYQLTITKGQPQIIQPESCDGFGWFSQDEVSQLVLSDITIAILEMLKK